MYQREFGDKNDKFYSRVKVYEKFGFLDVRCNI